MCENSATKNGTILGKFQNSATKKVPFEYSVKKFENQNTVPFEQSEKNLKQKWYHLRKVRKFWNKTKKGTNCPHK